MMNKTTEQKRIIAAALGLILQEKKKLYEKAVSLSGYEFGESEDEETAVAWTGAGVFVSGFREPETLPRKETAKPVARRALLNYPPEETPSRRGLNGTGGIR